jgi:hypothetical protein
MRKIIIQGDSRGKSIFLEVMVQANVSKKVYMNMCPNELFLLIMADTITSQSTDISSWITLYTKHHPKLNYFRKWEKWQKQLFLKLNTMTVDSHRLWSSALSSYVVVWVVTDVSEQRIASTFRVVGTWRPHGVKPRKPWSTSKSSWEPQTSTYLTDQCHWASNKCSETK